MTHAARPRPDPFALAAQLRLWVIDLVVWLAEMLGEGPLSAALRSWTMSELAAAERGAKGLVVLAAMRLLPDPDPLKLQRRRHPQAPPRGFARVAVRGNDMRRMTRSLFPRERDVTRRAARLGALLDALDHHAACLARRIARVRPALRIALVAPLAQRIASCAETEINADDSS